MRGCLIFLRQMCGPCSTSTSPSMTSTRLSHSTTSLLSHCSCPMDGRAFIKTCVVGLGVRWGGDITQNSPGHWVSWFLIIFQTCPETLSAHSSSLVLVVTDRRHFDYCYIWNVKYKLTSHSVTTATTTHPQWSAFVTPCLAAVSIAIQSVRYFIIHFTPSDSWEIINSCLKLVLAR